MARQQDDPVSSSPTSTASTSAPEEGEESTSAMFEGVEGNDGAQSSSAMFEGVEGDNEAQTIYSARVPVPVPFRRPDPWRPVFTDSPPWNEFPLPEPPVPDVDPRVVRQVAGEAANWLLYAGMTTLREEPDEERAPGIGKRRKKLERHVEKWREDFFAELPPDSPIERKPFRTYPDDPRPFISGLTVALLMDGKGGGGGGPSDESVDDDGMGEGGSHDGEGEGDGEGGEGEAEGQGKGQAGESEAEGDAEGDEDSESGEAGKEKGKQGKQGEEGEDGEEQEDSSTILDAAESRPPKDPKTQQHRETLARLLPKQRGYGTTGQDPSIDPQKLEELAERFSDNKEWSRFLDLIGRISSDAWSPPARDQSAAREDVRDLELGADIARIIPSEQARFAVPELAASAYADFAEKRMMQIAMEGHEPKGKGPILVAIDLSGSMNDPSSIRMGKQKNRLLDIALVLALGLIRVADVQTRKVFLLGYTEDIAFEMALHTPADRVDAMLFLSRGLTPFGGTLFDPPLRALAQRSKEYQGGDLLMITDGEGTVSKPVEALVNAERRKGLRVFSLLLAGNTHGLSSVSDVTVHLRSEKDLTDLGSAIAKKPAAAIPAAPAGRRSGTAAG